MAEGAETEALVAVFAAPRVPSNLLRPQAIRASRELWRRGVPERRIAALLHLTVPMIRELLTSRSGPPPMRQGRPDRTPRPRPLADA